MPTIQQGLRPCLLGVLASLTLSGAQAQEYSNWNIKVGGVLVDTSTRFEVNRPASTTTIVNNDVGLGSSVTVEYRATPLVGLEAGAVFAFLPGIEDDDGVIDDGDLGDGPHFWSRLAGVNFYVVRSDNLELFLGPRVAFVEFDDFDIDIDDEQIEYADDDEFAWGVTAGLKYRIGKSRWSLLAEATYLDVNLEATGKDGADVSASSSNPVMVNVGFSFNF